MIKVDKEAVVARYEDKERVPHEGFVTDYVGCLTDVSNYSHLKNRSGEVLDFPNPNDTILHEFIEYVGSCYAVDFAKDSFTVVELGAGNGIWSVRSSIMAHKKNEKNTSIVR